MLCGSTRVVSFEAAPDVYKGVRFRPADASLMIVEKPPPGAIFGS